MILVNPNFNEFKNDCKKRTFKKLTIEKIILKNTVWESHWSESQTKYFFFVLNQTSLKIFGYFQQGQCEIFDTHIFTCFNKIETLTYPNYSLLNY